MSIDNKSSQGVQDIIELGFQYKDDIYYKDIDGGIRIEVTGAYKDSCKRHFNIYITKDNIEVGQSVGVPQDKLATELDILCQLSCMF